MTRGSAPRSRGNLRRVHPAVGTAAAAMVLTSACSAARIDCSYMPLTRWSHMDPRCGIPDRRTG
jgi:hypothetical protein